ncbi:MAG: XdhC/CoxI family protein [Acidimicrobiales bacterium]
MKDLLSDIERWRSSGQRVVLARVVGALGSGPREPGTAMAVSDGGEVAGSIAGGCVEGAVASEALAVLESGGARLRTFGYSDDAAVAAGLTCGGAVEIFLQRLEANDAFVTLFECLRDERPVAIATVIASTAPSEVKAVLGATIVNESTKGTSGSFADDALDRAVTHDLEDSLATGQNVTRYYGSSGEPDHDDVTVFFDVYSPPPRMIVIGAVDFTRPLVKIAKVLGYRVTVCDARAMFATRTRFPEADVVVVERPDRYLATVADQLGPQDAICVLTHDHTVDVPAIAVALTTKVGYLGAMGSRGTHAERVTLLVEAGVDQEQIHEIMAPIGLRIGSRNPEETAISICAEIIAHRENVTVDSLRDLSGPIHTVVS